MNVDLPGVIGTSAWLFWAVRIWLMRCKPYWWEAAVYSGACIFTIALYWKC